MANFKVGILGATGAVGQQMLTVLAERKFPISELRLFGSARSAGRVVNYEGQDVVIQEASLEAFKGSTFFWGLRTIRLRSNFCLMLPRWAFRSLTIQVPSVLTRTYRS